VDIFYAIVKIFVQGGPFMIPILIAGAVGTAIAIERYVTLTRMSVRNRSVWAQVEPALNSGDFDKARELTKDDSVISRLLGVGLALQGAVRRRDDVKVAMQEAMTQIMPRLEKRTHYLATLANIGMLMGLLGTVVGLINAFAAVANVNPAEKTSLLSASISVAMNNTALGLGLAITLLLAHMHLESKTAALVNSLEMAAMKFLNSVAERRGESQRVLTPGQVATQVAGQPARAAAQRA
jgi:biopolymer transport protein ExbB